eukprot:5316459-Prymnesium_polylepis.1
MSEPRRREGTDADAPSSRAMRRAARAGGEAEEGKDEEGPAPGTSARHRARQRRTADGGQEPEEAALSARQQRRRGRPDADAHEENEEREDRDAGEDDTGGGTLRQRLRKIGSARWKPADADAGSADDGGRRRPGSAPTATTERDDPATPRALRRGS